MSQAIGGLDTRQEKEGGGFPEGKEICRYVFRCGLFHVGEEFSRHGRYLAVFHPLPYQATSQQRWAPGLADNGIIQRCSLSALPAVCGLVGCVLHSSANDVTCLKFRLERHGIGCRANKLIWPLPSWPQSHTPSTSTPSPGVPTGHRGRRASAGARNKSRKRYSERIPSSVWTVALISYGNTMHRHARLQAHSCKAQANSGQKSDDYSLARLEGRNAALKWYCNTKEAILVAWPSIDAHRGKCVERAQKQGSPNGKVDEPSATPQTWRNPIWWPTTVGRLHSVEGAHVAQAHSGANKLLSRDFQLAQDRPTAS